jgi:CheY-like chemotaxis protein
LQESSIRPEIHRVADGEAAVDFLHRRGQYRKAPKPDLLLLDLNLPKKDGREVLAEIKADPALRRMPVVVLSTSASEADITASYERHANCYVVKPFDLVDMQEVLADLSHFWFGVSELPTPF